jgi:CBS domain-containing protein
MIAGDVMTPNPATVSPQARVAEAWDLMRELDIRHVPVVHDGELVGTLVIPGSREVVGIVSYADVLGAVQDLLEIVIPG